MPAFRDDREGLRQKIAELEHDLSALKSGETNEALRRLSELERELKRATKDLDEQRELLAEIQRRTRNLRETLDDRGEAAPVAEKPAIVEAPVVPKPIVDRAPQPRWRVWALAGVGALFPLGIALWFGVFRAGAPFRGALPHAPIPGAPHAIDPLAALELARAASGIDGELSAIQADVGRGGLVDFDRRRADNVAPLHFFFSDASQTVEVIVDRDGLEVKSTPKSDSHYGCGDPSFTFPCGTTVPEPRCSMQQLWEAARKVGASDDDLLFVMYAQRRSEDPKLRTPTWTIVSMQRGMIEIEDGKCEPPLRQHIQPKARPASEIPGAPHEVNPLAILDLAKDQAGLDADAVLTRIEARFVGDNGKVDLHAAHYDGSIQYIFADPIPPRDPSLPVGISAPDTRRLRAVYVSKEGMPVTPNAYDSELYASYSRIPVANPRCTLARVYELADLPKHAIAQMTYSAADATPLQPGRWTVEVPEVVSGRVVEDNACAELPKQP